MVQILLKAAVSSGTRATQTALDKNAEGLGSGLLWLLTPGILGRSFAFAGPITSSLAKQGACMVLLLVRKNSMIA